MSNNRIYELTVLLQPQLEEQPRKQLIEDILGMISFSGEEAEKPTVTEWGLRTMAYEIKDFREAFYVYYEGPMNGSELREIERQFAYNDDILRHLFVRKDS